MGHQEIQFVGFDRGRFHTTSSLPVVIPKCTPMSPQSLGEQQRCSPQSKIPGTPRYPKKLGTKIVPKIDVGQREEDLTSPTSLSTQSTDISPSSVDTLSSFELPQHYHNTSETRKYGKAMINLDKVMKGPRIGGGSFGQVFSGLYLETGTQVAIKVLELSTDEARLRAYDEEINVMKSVKHKNIVQFYGARIIDGSHHLYMELVTGGSLSFMIKHFGPLQGPLLGRITRDMVCGLAHLHSLEIIHRDIKGGNVLITAEGTAKLSDFGCSAILSERDEANKSSTLKNMRGSIPWMSPEMVTNQRYNLPTDIWSLGCTVLEMVSGKRPWFDVQEMFQVVFAIGQKERSPPYPSGIPNNVRQFLDTCLVIEPSDRPTAKALLRDIFLYFDLEPS